MTGFYYLEPEPPAPQTARTKTVDEVFGLTDQNKRELKACGIGFIQDFIDVIEDRESTDLTGLESRERPGVYPIDRAESANIVESIIADPVFPEWVKRRLKPVVTSTEAAPDVTEPVASEDDAWDNLLNPDTSEDVEVHPRRLSWFNRLALRVDDILNR